MWVISTLISIRNNCCTKRMWWSNSSKANRKRKEQNWSQTTDQSSRSKLSHKSENFLFKHWVWVPVDSHRLTGLAVLITYRHIRYTKILPASAFSRPISTTTNKGNNYSYYNIRIALFHICVWYYALTDPWTHFIGCAINYHTPGSSFNHSSWVASSLLMMEQLQTVPYIYRNIIRELGTKSLV